MPAMRPTRRAHRPPALTTCSAVTAPCSVSSRQCPFGSGASADHAVAQHDFRAALPRGPGKRVRRAMRIERALVRVEQAAQKPRRVDDRAVRDDLLGAGEPRSDSERLVNRRLRLEPLPARGSRGEAVAARHVHADVLPALLLDLRVQLDRVGLQRGDIRVVVEHVKSRRGVPGRTGSELRALDQCDVRPAAPGEVIQHAGADDAAADDHGPVVTLQAGYLMPSFAETLCLELEASSSLTPQTAPGHATRC